MRHIYHIQGVTDLEKMREDARRRFEKDGEEAIIHHHMSGTDCALETRQVHDIIKAEEPKPDYPEEDES